MAFLPGALAFLVIMVVGWIIAKLLRKGLSKLLARVGLDRVAERGGLRRFTGKYTVSQLCGLLVYAAVLLMALQMAFGVFGPNPVSNMIEGVVTLLPHLFVALIIMVVAFAIANMVFDLVSGTMASMSYGRPMARIAQVLIIAVAGIAALNQVGIATTVTTPILVAILAMVAGVVIVGVGGGLIAPMRSRWERMLGTAESEAANLKQQTGSGPEVGEFAQPSYASEQYGTSEMDSQQPQQATAQHRGEPPMPQS